MSTERAKSSKRQSNHPRQTTGRTDNWHWSIGGQRLRTRSEPTLRERVGEGFRNAGKGVDARAAYEQTKQWFRSGGTEWARRLF